MVKPEESKPAGESQDAEKPAPPTSEPAAPDASTSEDTQAGGSAEATAEPAVEPKPAPPAVSKPAPKIEAPAAVPTNPGDERLVADGEKYLYGNGVPENCTLAEKNLRGAAVHSNPRALSMLGAMYATGHCVTRDLPMAYRSFARALHQDPNNNRIQRDLEVLWRQMTAEERQVAMKNQ